MCRFVHTYEIIIIIYVTTPSMPFKFILRKKKNLEIAYVIIAEQIKYKYCYE